MHLWQRCVSSMILPPYVERPARQELFARGTIWPLASMRSRNEKPNQVYALERIGGSSFTRFGISSQGFIACCCTIALCRPTPMKLLARMGVRRPEPNHNACSRHGEYAWFFRLRLADCCVIPYLRPTTSRTTSGPPRSRLGSDRSSVILLLQKQRPDDPRCLVGQRDCYKHARLRASICSSREPFGAPACLPALRRRYCR